MKLCDNIKVGRVAFIPTGGTGGQAYGKRLNPSQTLKVVNIMEEIVNLFVNNGIGVACVIYLIYFQNTTMTKMLDALNSINTRLSIIEDKLENK